MIATWRRYHFAAYKLALLTLTWNFGEKPTLYNEALKTRHRRPRDLFDISRIIESIKLMAVIDKRKLSLQNDAYYFRDTQERGYSPSRAPAVPPLSAYWASRAWPQMMLIDGESRGVLTSGWRDIWPPSLPSRRRLSPRCVPGRAPCHGQIKEPGHGRCFSVA